MPKEVNCDHHWICDYCIDCGSYLISIKSVGNNG